ncbi:MAG: hypothetical protein QOD00_2565 [Blastocatellia bacterium]|jgi:hypothetical protein|nr:hypothetical protein [Blastocatellia bacterium]
MAERRKILIPTGAEDTDSLETPHFDTEATRSARPVVPLSAESGDLGPLPQSVHYTQSEPVRRAKISPWLLGLVILAAMSAGAAGALALDYYRNHKHEETQAAIQPSDAAVAADTSGTRPTENPLQENRQIESPALPASSNAKKAAASPSPAHEASPAAATVSTEKSPEPAARPKSPAATQPEHPAREERRQDERQPDTREARRERQREVTSEEGPDDPDPRRPGRRRHGRDIEVRPEDVPPQVKRANQELHRIREIFEGTRP